jgi:uncharacterized membrane protein (DUF106 family)
MNFAFIIKKAMSLQKQAMESSMEMMKQSFRSMFYTFIPIIIMFGWVGSHYAFMPFEIGDEFNTTLMAKKEFFRFSRTWQFML